MDGMVINNLSAQATTECGLLQQELLKSFVEARKQRGITESLIQRLAEKKDICYKRYVQERTRYT